MVPPPMILLLIGAAVIAFCFFLVFLSFLCYSDFDYDDIDDDRAKFIKNHIICKKVKIDPVVCCIQDHDNKSINFPIGCSTLVISNPIDIEEQLEPASPLFDNSEEIDSEISTIDGERNSELVVSIDSTDGHKEEVSIPKEIENGHDTHTIFRKGSILIRSSLMRKSSSFSTSMNSPMSCSICCENYKVGDDISWSTNDICKHAFHTDCITHWLMRHNDCPLCRANYLTPERIQ